MDKGARKRGDWIRSRHLGRGNDGMDERDDWASRRRLLRARRERPGCRGTDQRDEVAPLHSITSSAMASTPGGIVSPRAFAALRLMTNSNLVGCNTGRSAGFSPLRMRPV